MDQPYQPPVSESPACPGIRKPGEKARRAARILACGVLLAGTFLLVALSAMRGYGDLLNDKVLEGVPRFFQLLLTDKPDLPVFAGMGMAVLAILTAPSRLVRAALALAIAAILMLGGWAALVFFLLARVIGRLGA